jgi:hypothetical protein
MRNGDYVVKMLQASALARYTLLCSCTLVATSITSSAFELIFEKQDAE